MAWVYSGEEAEEAEICSGEQRVERHRKAIDDNSWVWAVAIVVLGVAIAVPLFLCKVGIIYLK